MITPEILSSIGHAVSSDSFLIYGKPGNAGTFPGREPPDLASQAVYLPYARSARAILSSITIPSIMCGWTARLRRSR
jgi:hypothetical protein